MPQIFQIPRAYAVDGNGKPYAGARAFFYVTGTTTPKTTYSDYALSVPNANPVVADSNGLFPSIFLATDTRYRVVMKTSVAAGDVTLYTQDDVGGKPVSAADIGAALYPQTSAELSASVTPSDYTYPSGDVRRYGAVGDGATDDSLAVRSAIKVNDAGGPAVSLTAGKVHLLTTWTYYSTTNGVTINGNGATLKGPVSATSFLSPGGTWDIHDTTFDRWDSVVKRLLADSGSYQEFRFLRNICKNGTGYQIYWERPISNYWIEGNRFDTCSGGYAVKVGENTYANQDLYLKGFVRGNVFKSISASGATSCAAALIYGRETAITDNVIDGISGASGEGWGFYTKVRYGVISGNRIRNVKSTSSSDVVGLNVKGAPRSLTTSGVQGYAMIVMGNNIYDVGVAGVKGAGIRAQIDDALVYGNTCENTGLVGIVADDSNGSQNIMIAGNRVIMPGTATDYGIKLECNGVRIRVINNTIDGPVGGILVGPVSGPLTCTDFEVSGNMINCTAGGVAFPYNTFVNLTYLRITNNTVIQASLAIQNNGGVGTWSLCRIIDNDFARAATTVSGTLPTGAIADNAGYMEGSATYDPPSLIDAAGTTTTVTCNGALVGDYATASFSNDLQGIIVTAWVSSSGTVSVRFQNESGATVDLASGTLKVRAERR